MISVKDSTDSYEARFCAIEQAAMGGDDAWLLPTRKAAFARFGELGFPTVKDEEWRYTNVAAVAETVFDSGPVAGASVTGDELASVTGGELSALLLVFVNGRFSEALSHLGRLPAGLSVTNLGKALCDDRAGLEPFLARRASVESQAFTALNTAMFEDGAVVRVARGAVIPDPIHVLYVSTAADRPFATFPRNLLLAGENSQVTMVETYLGLGDIASLTNAVTEIVCEDGGVVDHYRVIRESMQAYHMSDLHVHQGRGSRVSSLVATFGGALVRNDVNAVLAGEGGTCTLNGLSLIGGDQHVDNHLRVDHAKPNCDSREYYKGVLHGRSRCVFSGRIIVRKDAQKTDAKQSNKSLLLSDHARVESKPQLEILADDVKCTHGATIGQVSKDEIFYLRTRGVDETAARRILVWAFAQESVDAVHVPALREQLTGLIDERLTEFFGDRTGG